MKELGIEGGTVFATESAEVLDPREWEERDRRRDGAAGADEALLTREERELQGVKRAEDEERHGTKGRDLMGSAESSGVGGGSGASVGVAMKMDEAGKGPLKELGKSGESEEGMTVQYVSLLHWLFLHFAQPRCVVGLFLMLRDLEYRPLHRELTAQLLRRECSALRLGISDTFRRSELHFLPLPPPPPQSSLYTHVQARRR